MSYLININSDNVINSNNTIYKYNFVNGSFTSKNCEMCISQAQIPYAWYNVSNNYNNNSFKISWTVGGVLTLYTIVLPDGFYTIEQINEYINQFCIINGFYLIDSNGDYVYYFKIVDNATYYKVQLLLYSVPSSLPTGYTLPSNFAGFPTIPTTPEFVILNNNFQILTGFNAGTYGGGNVDLSYLSQNTPLGANVNSLIIRCSFINNNISFPNDILDVIPIEGATFGENINYSPTFEKWTNIINGSYSSMTISIVDQNYNTIYSLDNNICITFLIREKKI